MAKNILYSAIIGNSGKIECGFRLLIMIVYMVYIYNHQKSKTTLYFTTITDNGTIKGVAFSRMLACAIPLCFICFYMCHILSMHFIH